MRWKGCRVLAYLDDLPFAQTSAEAALRQAQRMFRILHKFGWLVHPTKCIGLHVPVSIFVALETLIDLETQTYRVTEDTIAHIAAEALSLLQGSSSITARMLASFKGLVGSTWVATGTPTRIRTRAMDAVVGKYMVPCGSARDKRRAYDTIVELSAEARKEVAWWATNIRRISGQPILPRPLDEAMDSVIRSDASDTGYGACIAVEGPLNSPSKLCDALMARAPTGTSVSAVRRHARQGIEFMGKLPPSLLEASSTLRELFGLGSFILEVAPLLRGGRHLVVLDNMGCVFILGGIVPSANVGNKQWGEWVSGGSPNPDLQQWALAICDAEIQYDFKLVPVWRPREENVQADWLSHTSEMRLHDYTVRDSVFQMLDYLWGPHSIDRFASRDNCQRLATPYAYRYCSQCF